MSTPFNPQNREQMRQMYQTVWHKYDTQQPLTPLEDQIAQVLVAHPEYHSEIKQNHQTQTEYPPELGLTNPFLHMGLHISIQEQVHTNRPEGIRSIYDAFCKHTHDPHTAEHLMMDFLFETLYHAQKHNTLPDEEAYLTLLRTYLNDKHT